MKLIFIKVNYYEAPYGSIIKGFALTLVLKRGLNLEHTEMWKTKTIKENAVFELVNAGWSLSIILTKMYGFIPNSLIGFRT